MDTVMRLVSTKTAECFAFLATWHAVDAVIRPIARRVSAAGDRP